MVKLKFLKPMNTISKLPQYTESKRKERSCTITTCIWSGMIDFATVLKSFQNVERQRTLLCECCYFIILQWLKIILIFNDQTLFKRQNGEIILYIIFKITAGTSLNKQASPWQLLSVYVLSARTRQWIPHCTDCMVTTVWPFLAYL